MDKKNQNLKKKKRSNTIMIIIIIVAVCVIGFAAYKLIGIYSGYKEASVTYEKVEAVFETKSEEDPDAVPFDYDYDALLKVNKDALGWIYEKDLFSYPVVQASDNDTYLHQLIDGTPNDCGTPFVDCNCSDGLSGTYSIVYAHNMNDGSMFGKLSNYEDSAFYKDHQKIHVFIKKKHYVYRVFGAFTTSVNSYIYNDALNNTDVKDYVKKVRADNPYEMYDEEIDNDDHILILSTCTNNSDENYRYVVALVRDYEVK